MAVRGSGVRRPWDQRFDYCIQEPWAEASLDTVTGREKGVRGNSEGNAGIPAKGQSYGTSGIAFRMNEIMETARSGRELENVRP